MTITERDIAAALAARAGGITMDTNTIERAFAQVQERATQDRRRRRAAAVGAGALATAAAVLAAFTVVGGLPWQDDAAQFAEREQAVLGEPFAVGAGAAEAGTTYSVQDAAVPFTFSVPDQGEVPGIWRYGAGEPFTVGLEASGITGHASVSVFALERVYHPGKPWSAQDALMAAPATALGWVEWLEGTGYAEIVSREDVEVGGARAVRLEVQVADTLPAEYAGCAPSESCLAFAPIGTGTVGSGPQSGLPAGSTSELTVIEVEDRSVLAQALGAGQTQDMWLPLMRAVVDSLRFA